MSNHLLTTGDEPSLSGAQSTKDQLEPGLGGEAALTHLIETIHHEDTQIRCRAVEQLEAVGSERAIDLLEQVTADPNAFVRIRAIRALGKTQSERAVAILLDKFQTETDYQVIRQLIQALGETGSERVIEPLIQNLQSDDRPPRDHPDTALALSQIGTPKAVEALAQVLLGQSLTRYTAAWTLHQIGVNYPDTIHPLIGQFMKVLSGPPGQDRSRAIRFLADARPPGLVDQMLEVMKDLEKLPHQRVAAVLTLRAIGDKQFTGPMLELLATTQNGQLRYRAEQALINIRVRENIPTIIDLLKHEEWQVRRSAIRILGRRDARSAVPHIVKFLEDDRAPMRKAAADALGRLYRADGISQVVEPLIDALGDRGSTVRKAAARALGKLRRVDNISLAIDPLINALRDQADSVRKAASFALACMDDPGVVRALTTFFQDSDDVQERREAMSALYWLHFSPFHAFGGDDLSVIRSALDDPDNEVALTARSILERLFRGVTFSRPTPMRTDE